MSIDDTAVLNALTESPVFSVLDDAVLVRLADAAERHSFAKGDALLLEGAVGEYGYLILAGDVSIEVATPTGAVSVAEIGAGRLVGEIGAFSDVPRTASVIALSDVEALRLERSAIQTAMGDNMDLAMNVIGRLGLRLQNISMPMAMLTQAAEALRNGTFTPAFLDSLSDGADQFAHFAEVFKSMALELQEKHKQLQELETAQRIQLAFLPDGIDLSSSGGTEIEAQMIAAKHVGGDFYDYFLVDEDHLGFLVGDVAGKGVPAALFMARTLSVLRAVALSGRDPGTCLTQTNGLVCERNDQDMFVTVFYGVLNLRNGEITYCNGGHEPGIRKTAADEIFEHPSSGPALGLFEAATFRSQTLSLMEGDMFMVYSDGVTEAFDPEGAMFGEERLSKTIQAANQRTASGMTQTLMDAVDAFAAGRERADDTTVLTLRFGA